MTTKGMMQSMAMAFLLVTIASPTLRAARFGFGKAQAPADKRVVALTRKVGLKMGSKDYQGAQKLIARFGSVDNLSDRDFRAVKSLQRDVQGKIRGEQRRARISAAFGKFKS